LPGANPENPENPVVFATVDLAARIDHAEARLTASLAGTLLGDRPGAFVEMLGGGVAAFVEPASPMNKMIGVGFDVLPADDRLTAIEKRFATVEAPLQAEVSTLANPEFAAALTRRGYVLRGFENVLGCAIRRSAIRENVEHIRIDVMGSSAGEQWLDAAVTGFSHPDEQGVPGEQLPPRDELERLLRPFLRVDGFRRYGAYIDGALAGVATLRMDEGIAQLAGAATLPQFRRRGVQTALLRHRLAEASQAGCDAAVMTTQPGSKSQENGQRQGFALLYSRAVLVRDPL
jgi:ribosomal protein S18 acetylase RimI-like enzyme